MLEPILFCTIALAALLSAPQFGLHDDGLTPSVAFTALLIALLAMKMMGWWPR